MYNHTPGPWKWYWRLGDKLRADCGVLHEKMEGHAYSICRAPQYEKKEQWEANAKLIAAAPDLLEVCKEALWVVESTHGKPDLVKKMKEAINKAS